MIATYLYKRLKLLYFNRKNGTNIRSVRASLRASYGKSVSVGSGTIVTDDVSMGN